MMCLVFFFFSSRRRHTRWTGDWSSDVCSSDLDGVTGEHQFTLYATGLQLSLVVMPASGRAGLPPQSVALYDADGRLARPWLPDVALATGPTARDRKSTRLNSSH